MKSEEIHMQASGVTLPELQGVRQVFTYGSLDTKKNNRIQE